METEHAKRSILKTVTWRITASLDTLWSHGLLPEIGRWVDQLQELKWLQKCFSIIFTKEYGIKLNGEKGDGGGYLSLSAICSAK